MVAWVSFGFLVSSNGPTSHGQANHSGPVAVMMAMFADRHVHIRVEASVRGRNRRTAVLT
jgi:hypothetical protein